MPPAYAPHRRRDTGGERREPAPVAQAGRGRQVPSRVPPARTPVTPAPPAQRHPTASRTARPRRARRVIGVALVIFLVAAIAWPAYLLHWANGKIAHVDALTDHPATSGTTWLIAGSDRRSDGSDGGIIDPTTLGARTDSIMLVRRVAGQASVVSLPRDLAVEIPGKGVNKLNAAYALGGPQLLVATVEKLTNVKVDHYAEVTMGAVTQIVDALGGLNLCMDLTVHDELSGLDWQSGCHDVDGQTALAFSRMRYSDPRGDIGREERQRQVVHKMVDKALAPSSVLNPFTQRQMGGAVASALITDPDTGVGSLAWLAWNYRKAQGDELTGTPPISSLNYTDGVHGSMVRLDQAGANAFWQEFADGDLTPNSYWDGE